MTEVAEPLKHNWTDAWLLLAIIYANKNGVATLDRVIAAGDLINQAVFKPEEFESGLFRLTAGGYITQDDRVFNITEKLTGSSRKISLGSGFVNEDLKQIELLLTTSRRQRPLPNNLKYAGFSLSVFKAALKKHIASFEERSGSRDT